jgi:hypothetical protein
VARLESGPEASAESNARESSAAAFELDVHLESEEEFVGDQAAPETALAKPLSKRGTVAVADAEPMRAPPAASVAKAKEAARVFEERDGIHYQAGYANQELTRVERGSDALDDLLEAHPAAREDIERHNRIVLLLGKTWFSIEPAKD